MNLQSVLEVASESALYCGKECHVFLKCVPKAIVCCDLGNDAFGKNSADNCWKVGRRSVLFLDGERRLDNVARSRKRHK